MDNRILIVDDEMGIRDSLSQWYLLKGYKVETAGNGIEALKKLEENSFKVVVSDIMMPEMSGVDLLREIRKEYPMIRVIMMTGYVTLDNALSCLRHGADTCIFKPIEDQKEMDIAIKNAFSYLQHWEKKLLQLHNLKPKGLV